MNKAIAIKIIKHFVIFIIILLCLSAIPATFMAMSPFNDMREYIAEFEAWGWCEGFELVDDCEYYLYTNDGLSGRIFRYYFVGFFWVLFVVVSVIYGLVLWLKWLWKNFINKTNLHN